MRIEILKKESRKLGSVYIEGSKSNNIYFKYDPDFGLLLDIVCVIQWDKVQGSLLCKYTGTKWISNVDYIVERNTLLLSFCSINDNMKHALHHLWRSSVSHCDWFIYTVTFSPFSILQTQQYEKECKPKWCESLFALVIKIMIGIFSVWGFYSHWVKVAVIRSTLMEIPGMGIKSEVGMGSKGTHPFFLGL